MLRNTLLRTQRRGGTNNNSRWSLPYWISYAEYMKQIQTNSTSSSPSSLDLLTTASKTDDKIKIILAMAVGLKNFIQVDNSWIQSIIKLQSSDWNPTTSASQTKFNFKKLNTASNIMASEAKAEPNVGKTTAHMQITGHNLN